MSKATVVGGHMRGDGGYGGHRGSDGGYNW